MVFFFRGGKDENKTINLSTSFEIVSRFFHQDGIVLENLGEMQYQIWVASETPTCIDGAKKNATDSNMTSLYKPLMHIYIYVCHLYYQVCSLCAILFSKICFAFISWCHGDLHIVTFRPWRQHFGTSQGAQRPPEGAVMGTQWPEDLSLKQKNQPCVQPAWIHFCCKLVCLQSGGFCTTVSLDFNVANHNAVDHRRWYGGCFAGKFLSSLL